jgi:hypothetical protein
VKLTVRISARAADFSELSVIFLSFAVQNPSNTLKYFTILNISTDYSHPVIRRYRLSHYQRR